MDSPEKALSQLHQTLENHFKELRFARAAELARSGRFLEAEGLLSLGGQESSDPKELDLLARMAALQHQYDRARHLWGRALQKSSDPAPYKRSIECTKEEESRRAKIRIGAMAAIVVLSVGLAILATQTFLHNPPGSEKDRDVRQPPAEAKLPAPNQPEPAKTTSQEESSPNQEAK